MIELQTLSLNSQQNFDELSVVNQKKILGGLQAGNSMQLNADGSVATFNFTHLQSGDSGKVVNQVNAPPGTSVFVPYDSHSNDVVNQVNATGPNSLVVIERI